MAGLPNGVITISSVDIFNEIVNKFRENLIIVEFFADWCVPCKSFRPIYEALQQQYYSKGIIFTRVDSDAFPEVMQQFSIMGYLPCFLLKIRRGSCVNQEP